MVHWTGSHVIPGASRPNLDAFYVNSGCLDLGLEDVCPRLEEIDVVLEDVALIL